MGYTWEGMNKITKAEAVERFNNGLDVYRLYEDDSEGLCESMDDILSEAFYDYDFGYENGLIGMVYNEEDNIKLETLSEFLGADMEDVSLWSDGSLTYNSLEYELYKDKKDYYDCIGQLNGYYIHKTGNTI